MNYWNQKQECMPRSELEKLQGERLRELVAYEYERVPLYRAKMDAAGVKPADIMTLADITKLPFTTKQDLRDAYPYGMFAAPMSEINRIHASSGTTGKQTVCGYTKGDLDVWKECMSRSLAGAGATRESIVHVSYGYGLFTGGLGAHDGATAMGCAVIPVSTGNTARQITILKDFGPDVLCCTPSYALYLSEALRKSGLGPDDIKLKAGIFGAEPWTEEMRPELEKGLGIKAYDIYGLSEVMGPSVACECSAQDGMHVQEDHFIIEIIDPATGEVLPEGETGEVVFTTITKRGMPLVRYRTRDLSHISRQRCTCGRTTARLFKITGRSDDMLIIRGVNVFPSQIESVLLELGETAPYYFITVDRVNNLDVMEVQVEMTEKFFSDSVKEIEALENKIRARLLSVLGISVNVKLVEPNSLPRSEGKAVRVKDLRKLA